MGFQELRETTTVTIANGASLSGAVDLLGVSLVGIIMPAAWTAAVVTFQGSADNSTFNNVYDDAGNEYSFTVAASRFVHVVPSEFAGIRYLKVRSGTAASAVNQGAARTITLVVRPV